MRTRSQQSFERCARVRFPPVKESLVWPMNLDAPAFSQHGNRFGQIDAVGFIQPSSKQVWDI
jgi:hypothetical protein